jgi:hypothetical protein
LLNDENEKKNQSKKRDNKTNRAYLG